MEQLKDNEFRLIRDYIQEFCGIYFDDSKAETMLSRLSFRMKVLDISSCIEYYNYLRFNPRCKEEMENLIPHLTNNETYFFREAAQLSLLVEKIREKAKKPVNGSGNAIRILSCGCSSGEEAFTLAMMLEEAGVYASRYDIQITGIDINGRIIEKAEQGLYSGYSLRAADGEHIERYFRKDGDRHFLDDRIRKKVVFRRGNLMEQDALEGYKAMDAIICRNVFIYLSECAIKRIVESFYDILKADGILLLGHSETLARITDSFRPERFSNVIIYSKKGV